MDKPAVVDDPPASLNASPPARLRLVALVLLALVYSASYADRQLLLVLAEPIKQDLGLTDTQVGMLGGLTFALFYTVFGLPVAWLADRVNRVRIVAAACALWSLCTAACGLAGSFLELAVARMAVGVGEAGGTAPSFSILSDLYRPHERGRAIAGFSLGSPAGVLVGTAVGGAVAAEFGWRTAFLVMSAPGLLIAVAVLLLVREPIRGASDPLQAASSSASSPVATIRLFLANPALWRLTLASGLCGFVAIGLASWAPAYLLRTKGMSLGQLSAFYSLVAALAVSLGVWLGGSLADRFSRKDQRAYARLPGALFLLAVPFIVATILAPGWPLALALLFVPLCFTTAQVPPALAYIHNNTPPEHRATASAVFLFVLNLIGIGGGPLFVGLLSDAAARVGAHDPLGVGLGGLAVAALLAVGALWAASRAIPLQPPAHGPS